MTTDTPTPPHNEIRFYVPVEQLILLGKPGGFEHWMVPCPLGARPDSYDALRQFVEALVVYMIRELGCSHESFVTLSRKADPSAKFLFAENARHWNPETGLGVLPHQPPPRMIRATDVSDLDPEDLPQVMHTMFRVKKTGTTRLNAMTTMLGTGASLQILSRLEGPNLLSSLKDQHLEFIEDPLYRIFPWYIPLLDQAALDEPLCARTISVMRKITLYVRESPENGGVLILSSEPLTGLVEQFGCTQLSEGKNPQWRLGRIHC